MLAAGAGLLAGLAGCGGLVGREEDDGISRITDDETPYPESQPDAGQTTTPPGRLAGDRLTGSVPTFQYDRRNTGSTDASGPEGTPSPVGLAEVPGAIRSPPVVAGGVAYLGGLWGALVAIDTGSGEVLWSQSGRRREYSGVRETPAVAGERVYHATWWGSVVARTRDGELLWTFTADEPQFDPDDEGYPMYGTDPVVADGRVYVSRGDGLFAVDARDGTQRWKIPVRRGGIGAPAAADGRVLYTRSGGSLVAADAASGEPLWAYDTDDGTRQRAVTVGDSLVYAVMRDPDAVPPEADDEGSPVTAAAVDAESGEERWTFEAGAVAGASAALADGTLYLPGGRGTLYAVDAASGAERWRRDLGGRLPFAPVVADGVVHVVVEPERTTEGAPGPATLQAVGHDGERRWSVALQFPPETAPVVLDGHVLVAADRRMAVYG